jgi:small neutral amino acid transporter SnatA (MarC family)
MAVRTPRTRAFAKGNRRPSKRSGRLWVAVATLAAAVLVLPTAPAILGSLGVQLSSIGQRISGILAAAVALIALPFALHELVKKYGDSWRPRTQKLFMFPPCLGVP